MMLKMMTTEEIPGYHGDGKSEISLWVQKTVDEFMLSDSEACEIVEMPKNMTSAKLAPRLRDELWRRKVDKKIKVTQRKERLFMFRVATETKGRMIEVGGKKQLKMPAALRQQSVQ